LCITVSAPVTDDKGEIRGVFGVDLRFEDVLKIDRKMESGKGAGEEGKGGVEGEII
jgi:hypothetical protein